MKKRLLLERLKQWRRWKICQMKLMKIWSKLKKVIMKWKELEGNS